MDEDFEGECKNFEVVPGYGLKCSVSGMEAYTRSVKWKYSRLMARHVCVSTTANFMVKDIELGAGSRAYEVSLRHC